MIKCVAVVIGHQVSPSFSQEIPGGQVHEFQVLGPHQQPRMYKLKLGDEAIQAPMALFFPQLFGIVGERLVFSPEHHYEASEDLLGDRHFLEVSSLKKIFRQCHGMQITLSKNVLTSTVNETKKNEVFM